MVPVSTFLSKKESILRNRRRSPVWMLSWDTSSPGEMTSRPLHSLCCISWKDHFRGSAWMQNRQKHWKLPSKKSGRKQRLMNSAKASHQKSKSSWITAEDSNSRPIQTTSTLPAWSRLAWRATVLIRPLPTSCGTKTESNRKKRLRNRKSENSFLESQSQGSMAINNWKNINLMTLFIFVDGLLF